MMAEILFDEDARNKLMEGINLVANTIRCTLGPQARTVVIKQNGKPVVINDNNKEFLMKLIQNGPDVHPGAKILEKKNGENIYIN